MNRRYFKVATDEALALYRQLVDEFNAHRERLRTLQDTYGAAGLLQTSDRLPVALLYHRNATKGAVPPGLRSDGLRSDGEVVHSVWKPSLNTKAGKAIHAAFRQVGKMSISQRILRHYDIEIMLVEGNTLHVAVAGLAKGVLVASIPETATEPFTPPAGFEELKKSEWGALTEE